MNSDELLSRLPPGRHGLPREFVRENQLARISAGMIAVVAKSGYQDATISQIAETSGVSRRTFYNYFDSKEACFASVLSQIAEHLLEQAEAAGDGLDGGERLEAELSAVLATFEANPDLALTALVAPLSAGQRIASGYRRALREAATRLPGHQLVARAALNGLASLIAQGAAGEGGLPGRMDEIKQFALVAVG